MVPTAGVAPALNAISTRCLYCWATWALKLEPATGFSPACPDLQDRCTYLPRRHMSSLVGVAGLEPASAAYLALTLYKRAALPIELHSE